MPEAALEPHEPDPSDADLPEEPVGELPAIDLGDIVSLENGEPKLRPIEDRQEDARSWIAKALVMIVAGIVLATFCTVWFSTRAVDDVADVVGVILAPVTGLLGAATGFYFGARARSNER